MGQHATPIVTVGQLLAAEARLALRVVAGLAGTATAGVAGDDGAVGPTLPPGGV